MVHVIDVRAQPRSNDIVVRCANPRPSYSTWDELYKAFQDVLIVVKLENVPMSGTAYLIRTQLLPENLGVLNELAEEIHKWLSSRDGGADPSDLQLS